MRISIILLVLLAALAVGACGRTQDAYAFCADRGGVLEDTWEDDGDVLCADGTEYEGDGDLAHGGFFRHHSKKSKPAHRRIVPLSVLNRINTYRRAHPRQSSSSSSGSSKRRSSSGGSRRSSGGRRR